MPFSDTQADPPLHISLKEEQMLEPVAYTRKPFDVLEVTVTEENMQEAAEWCGGTIKENSDGVKFIKVRVQRPITPRQTQAFAGDHLLKAPTGFKVYMTKAFESTFDRVK